MATFPTVALVPIYSASPGNTDIPQTPTAGTLDEFPTLTRIGITDLVGPAAANMQEKSLERRTWTTRDRINALIAGYNNLATYFLQRDGSTLPTANLPMGADGSGAGGYKLTFLAPGSSPYDSVRYDQITPLAPKASPVFSGTITAPTAAVDFSTAAQVRVPTVSPGDSSTLAASTAFVTAAIGALPTATPYKLYSQLITTNGYTFVPVAGVTQYVVTVVGGGGSGSAGFDEIGAGGGGSSSNPVLVEITGPSIAVIGAGGSAVSAGTLNPTAGNAGSSSSFAGITTPGGGGGGYVGTGGIGGGLGGHGTPSGTWEGAGYGGGGALGAGGIGATGGGGTATQGRGYGGGGGGATSQGYAGSPGAVLVQWVAP